MRIMLVFACFLAVAAAAPASYDQRQDGEFNVRADVQNVVFVVALPSKLSPFSGLFKSAKPHEPQIQERADIRVMEAFVEPSEPYHVEIGESGRTAEGEGRAVEVVIAGRRRLEAGTQTDDEPDEYKLLGATEQCGPDRERDPVSLMCRLRSDPPPINDDLEPQSEDQPQADNSTPQADNSQPQADNSLPQADNSQPQPEQPQPQPEPASNPSPEVLSS